MSANGCLIEKYKRVGGLAPVVVATAGVDSDIVSLRESEHVDIYIDMGTLGSASYLRITPYQGVAIATAATAIVPVNMWIRNAAKARSTTIASQGDYWLKTAWGANAYHDLTVANTAMLISIDASELTATNWVLKVNLDSDNNTGPTACVTIWGTTRKYGDQNTMIATA